MADRLTVREVSCLRLLEGGLKNKQIASQLGIAERTVSNTLQSAYRKLGVSQRQDAIAEFRRNWSETGHRLSMSPGAGTGFSASVSGPVSRPPTFYRPTPPGLVNTSVIIAVFAVIGVLAVLALVTSRAFEGLG
ncbi:helix-turn-helix transcriptional regulator [Roseibacterium beibuensis]|uniref:helix-turn-helix domain-containing protein n=1 Tax=[Roseibacterium] beibuensis TaxID=1193142 RepID=UPI00217E5B41|nr:helix-turn-helix transcriptional regulator [Roseibacterium beibuensis]MCS6625155.1 helix-turn-helix transcriptional regulator [Roseibacterium beibuensis]